MLGAELSGDAGGKAALLASVCVKSSSGTWRGETFRARVFKTSLWSRMAGIGGTEWTGVWRGALQCVMATGSVCVSQKKIRVIRQKTDCAGPSPVRRFRNMVILK